MGRAAELVGVSQPALSAMVKKLEAELATALFHRTGKGVELTEAGRVFLDHAEAALRSVEAGTGAVRELMGLERGRVRIGGGATAVGALLPPAVRAFRERHPGVRFYVREAGSRAVASAVTSGELDLGVVTLPLGGAAERDVLTVPLAADEFRLVVPAGHALEGRKTFRWADLRGEAVVAFEARSAVRGVIDGAAREAGVELDVAMELRSIGSIRRMVAAGVGVGFVSRYGLQAGEGLRCRDGKLVRQLAIVRASDRVPSAAASAFERELLAVAQRRPADTDQID